MWMKATEGADGTVFYIDRDSIKKEGALIRVWELQDLKAKGPLEEKSRRVLVEYDSKNERRRVLSFSFHGESFVSRYFSLERRTAQRAGVIVRATSKLAPNA